MPPQSVETLAMPNVLSKELSDMQRVIINKVSTGPHYHSIVVLAH